MRPADRGVEPRMIVFGSLNLDHVWRVRKLPSPGETVLCTDVGRGFGGKGANQAVAAARAGGRVTLVGAVGADDAGQAYRQHLASEGITSRLEVVDDYPTGAAHVYVDETGENLIVVHDGANAWWTGSRVLKVLSPVLADAAWLVLPAEIPADAARAALVAAEAAEVPVLFNASPCPVDFPWGDAPIDTVVVNEHECREIFHQTPESLMTLGGPQRRLLLETFRVSRLVLTCGGEPTRWLTESEAGLVSTYPVHPVDTVGAGDTFAGVLAVGLAEGLSFTAAIWRANIAAALSTLERGAQTAMPHRERIDASLLSPALPPK